MSYYLNLYILDSVEPHAWGGEQIYTLCEIR